MTRQRNPWRWSLRAIARAALGLAATALALNLYAPQAVASPETDAADAINAAWSAAGGDASPLGSKQGDVYPAGAGFAQDFADGAIFFTPETGAKMMSGAILDKYRALGGPADSDLGFPNMDEGVGLIGPDSRNVTFSAGDNPVIFWTPETGAWVVRGPINAAWDRLGGSAGSLGVPVADETYDGDIVRQQFTGGEVSFDQETKEFTTVPEDLAGQLAGLEIPSDPVSEINTAYRAAGGSQGPLGAPEGDPYPVGDNGTAQNFAGGKIFYTPDTGANALSGDILAKYEALGGPTGDLGFPASGEQDGGVPNSRMVTFTGAGGPVIFWTPDNRALAVRGAMKAAWDKLGGATGELGVPVTDQTVDGDVVSQRFGNGQVSWNSTDNAFTTEPANLAESLNDVQVPAGSTPAAQAPSGGDEGGGGLRWQTWWLWWIIPLAVLVLASLVAWVVMRRRRGGGEAGYDADEEYLDYGAPEREPEGDEGRWSSAAPELGADRIRFGDQDADEVGFLASRGRWAESGEPEDSGEDRFAERSAVLPDVVPEQGELFTHHGAHEGEDHDEYEDENPDDVDTAPTLIPAEEDAEPAGRHAASRQESPWAGAEDDYLPGPQSLFAPVYGAAPPPESRDEAIEHRFGEDEFGEEQVGEDRFGAGRGEDRAERGGRPAHLAEEAEPEFPRDQAPAIHLPLDDPDEAPQGYPVKGSMRTGTYHTPDSVSYQSATAEIWFASAELAEANGFTRAH